MPPFRTRKANRTSLAIEKYRLGMSQKLAERKLELPFFDYQERESDRMVASTGSSFFHSKLGNSSDDKVSSLKI